MEKLHAISQILPDGSFLSIEKTDYLEELNAKLEAWVKMAKPRTYRITNVSVTEIAHQRAVLYVMSIAYEKKAIHQQSNLLTK